MRLNRENKERLKGTLVLLFLIFCLFSGSLILYFSDKSNSKLVENTLFEKNIESKKDPISTFDKNKEEESGVENFQNNSKEIDTQNKTQQKKSVYYEKKLEDVDKEKIIEEKRVRNLNSNLKRIENELSKKETVKVIIEFIDEDKILEELSIQNKEEERDEFKEFPFLALDINKTNLEEIKNSKQVLAIQEDFIDFPTLDDSSLITKTIQVSREQGFNGSGQTVVILDTGVNSSHSFLSGRVIDEACYSSNTGISSTLCPGGATETNGSGTGMDCSSTIAGCGHGTHVGGIVAGNDSTNFGAAPGSTIVAINVFSEFPNSAQCGSNPTPCALSFTSDQIKGLERAYALRNTYNISAVSMSLGGGRFYDQASCDGSNTLRKAAIDNLRDEGIATIIASGNDGFGDSMGAPGCISTAISVGSTTKADAVSGFSNSVSFLNLLAPGQSIFSSYINGGFATLSGTSMATPHVSGAWAVVRQAFPDASIDEILEAFNETGVQIVDGKNSLSKPRIDVEFAIEYLYNQTINVSFSQFDGNTTNFNTVENISNVCSPVVEKSSNARINFNSCINATGSNLDENIIIKNNSIFLNSSRIPNWNTSANLTFYNVFLQSPIIVRNGVECDDCSIISNDGTNLTINVPHFSNYTVLENRTLEIFDDSDSQTVFVNQTHFFFSNYSDTDGTSISDASCSASFDFGSGFQDQASMSYNATSELYEYNRTFSNGGNYVWNSTCTHASYPLISTSEGFNVTPNATLIWSTTDLDLGTIYKADSQNQGSANLLSPGADNSNLDVSCQSGDCGKITDNFNDGINLNQGDSQSVTFTCDSSDEGNFSALFNATSDEFTNGTLINVSCGVIQSYGTLSVTFDTHPSAITYNTVRNEFFLMNATFTCIGDGVPFCGEITSYALDNSSGSLDSISTVVATTPFYTTSSNPQTCDLDSQTSCQISFIVNATASLNTNHLIRINASSNYSFISDAFTPTRVLNIVNTFTSNLNNSVSKSTQTFVGTSNTLNTSARTLDAQGGNTTNINFVANSTTAKWQGFFGNVEGNLLLGKDQSIFYTFNNVPFSDIIVTHSTNFLWSNITSSSANEIDSIWGFSTPSDIDQAQDIFTTTRYFNTVLNVPSTTIQQGFHSGIIKDGTGSTKDDYGFIANVNSSNIGFDSGIYDYHVMVPVGVSNEVYSFYLIVE